jgi:hypothetical protein
VLIAVAVIAVSAKPIELPFDIKSAVIPPGINLQLIESPGSRDSDCLGAVVLKDSGF